MIKTNRLLWIAVFIIEGFICSSCSSQPSDDDWSLISAKRKHSVSGVVVAENIWYVVHDNKKPDQPKMGWIDPIKKQYHSLEWKNKKHPIDLEALTTISDKPLEMVAMTSRGNCFHIKINKKENTVETIKEFSIPGVVPPMNLEGLSIQKTDGGYYIVWADRGLNDRFGNIFYGFLNLKTGTIEPEASHSFFTPWPENNVRHITDLYIEKNGNCWVSSASDPGDDGPFDSAVCRVGQFQLKNDTLKFTEEPNPHFIKEKQYKIEALNVMSGKGCFATDDENAGVYIKITKF